jgi:hypothetical protein
MGNVWEMGKIFSRMDAITQLKERHAKLIYFFCFDFDFIQFTHILIIQQNGWEWEQHNDVM